MRIRSILPAGLSLLFWIVPGWGQTQPAAPSDCAPAPQQQAAAMTPPAVTPVKPEEQGLQSPPPYQRLSAHEKFNVFVRHTYSPYTLGEVIFDAGMAQANGAWHSYGGGMEGYGKRFGASLADVESGTFFGRFLFPVMFHQDPRYLRSTSQSFTSRSAYALSRVLVTRADKGHKQPNVSLILSAFAASTLSNAYYPHEDRGAGDTAARAAGQLLGTAEMNLLREFWPDIVRKLKRGPRPIRKLQDSRMVTKIEEMTMGPTATPCPVPETPPAEEKKAETAPAEDKKPDTPPAAEERK